MANVIARFVAVVQDDHAQDLIEYALLASVIAIIAIAAIGGAGTEIGRLWTGIADGLPDIP